MSNNNKKDKQPLDSGEIGLVEMRSTSTPLENNDSLGISGTNKPDVTTGNLSHSDEASTSTPSLRDVETIIFFLDCAKNGEISANQRSLLICKASRVLRDHNESSFEPQLVSIGPIHSEDRKLKEFEWLKDVYLNDLLNRCKEHSTPKDTLEACLLKVNTLIPKIRKSYAGVIEKRYTDDELAKMMVMDGCFILGFCSKHAANGNMYLQMQNIRIAMDLMLLENQVPFVVLEALFECSMGNQSFTLSDVLDTYLAPYIQLFRSDLSDLLPEKNSILSNVLDYIKLFCSPSPEKNPATDVDSDSTHDHVLGHMHKRYQRVFAKSSNPMHAQASKLLYRSIVELDRSGINFKPHQEDNWSMTIKFQSPLFPCLPWFCGQPTLLMPTLVINNSTELILRNLIAYEQLFPEDRYCFTSYAVAMDILINTQEDIAKLAESEVLVNRLGSNQEAADMINKICKNMFITDFCYTEVFKQMDEYYKSFWHKNIARLRRVYFSSPWSIIALVAAIILFGLTVVQTIFAIKGK